MAATLVEQQCMIAAHLLAGGAIYWPALSTAFDTVDCDHGRDPNGVSARFAILICTS